MNTVDPPEDDCFHPCVNTNTDKEEVEVLNEGDLEYEEKLVWFIIIIIWQYNSLPFIFSMKVIKQLFWKEYDLFLDL